MEAGLGGAKGAQGEDKADGQWGQKGWEKAGNWGCLSMERFSPGFTPK